MNFMVLNRDKIGKFLVTDKHIVISVKDPNSERAKLPKSSSRLSVLDLEFDDVDWAKPSCAYIIFTKEMARQIVFFFNKYKDKVDLVICQCEAGISRSSAIAAGLSKIIGQDDSIYFKEFIPNRFVYRTILEEGLK